MENELLSGEIDLYVDTMKCFNVCDIGTQQWYDWHTRLLKLNHQAVLEVSAMKEEYVKEMLISIQKITVLVHEAILINVWKKKVLPHLIKFQPDVPQVFPIYSVLYHEGVCINLLEAVLFHGDSCEALGEFSLDLLDYCYENAAQLLTYKHFDPDGSESGEQELKRHESLTQFDIGIRSISILRYFAEYADSLHLTIISRMFKTLDVPLLFVELLNLKPWITHNKDKHHTIRTIYIDGQWKRISSETSEKLSSTEAQIWFGLRELLLNPKCFQYYEFSDFRKSQLFKLQKFLHETTLDQLSPLIELKHWLNQLAMSNVPQQSEKTVLLLEVLPEIRDKILAENRNNWKNIAKLQVKRFFNRRPEELTVLAQGLIQGYSSAQLESQISNSCSHCGSKADKKCSKCKTDFYCSRNCQVKHWPLHKQQCGKETL